MIGAPISLPAFSLAAVAAVTVGAYCRAVRMTDPDLASAVAAGAAGFSRGHTGPGMW